MHTIFKMTLVLRRTILCWNRTSRPMPPPLILLRRTNRTFVSDFIEILLSAQRLCLVTRAPSWVQDWALQPSANKPRLVVIYNIQYKIQNTKTQQYWNTENTTMQKYRSTKMHWRATKLGQHHCIIFVSLHNAPLTNSAAIWTPRTWRHQHSIALVPQKCKQCDKLGFRFQF